MIFKNIKLSRPLKISSWRKSAMGTWKVSGDSQVYSIQTISVENALSFIEKSSDKLTLTHLAAKASALMINKFPEINRIIRLGRFYQREEIAIFFQVSSDSLGKDLSGYTIREPHLKTLDIIAHELLKNSKEIKRGHDIHYKKVKYNLKFIPGLFISSFIKIYGFILFTLNLWSPLLGAPRDSFGSMMITNTGSLGMQTALVPLVPYSHCPLILALGKVYERPLVRDGKIIIEKSVDLGWTLDHRVIDGVIGAKMALYFEELMNCPEKLI